MPKHLIVMASNLIGHLLSQPLSKAGSRLQSQASGERPFSPSARSKAGSMPYPPLPESAYGDFEIPLSPKSRAYSKAPSISPSDSPSQMPKVRPVRTGSQLNGSECPTTFGFWFFFVSSFAMPRVCCHIRIIQMIRSGVFPRPR